TAGGSATVRKLGEYSIISEVHGAMPDDGEDFAFIMTVGFNARTQRFVRSWVGSMMADQAIYDGEMGGDGVLRLESQSEDFHDETKLARYRDDIESMGEDQWSFNSYFLDQDGQDVPIIRANFHRA
ncbi:MAG: hypothetical protein C4320_03255, partial [Armatimonadota bacterium]